MRKRLVVVAALCLLIAGLTGCDASSEAPPAAADARQVTVIGEGQVEGTPDTLTINASIQATAPDVTASLNQTSDRQQAVIDALVDSGVERKDISTTGVTVQEQYGPEPNRITGYQSTNTITVKIRDTKKASEALALIATTGGDATRINSVRYSIDDDAQLVRDARARAFDDAKDRAQQYAQLSGLKLGPVISITESGGAVPPTPFQAPRDSVAAAAPVPLEPGQQTVGFSVTVIWQLD